MPHDDHRADPAAGRRRPGPGSTTREVEQCIAADLAGTDAELNRYYSAAVKRPTDGRQAAALAKLRASERA